jgi:hypothetical protein
MRSVMLGTMILAVAAINVPATHAELLSKSYVFKAGVTLELGAETGDGLRVDSVKFKLPATVGERTSRVAGLATAHVAVSNTGTSSQKVGVALALFDDEGRLLGVASGGTSLVAIKPGRQKAYTLVFDNVNTLAHRATKFQLSLESKP